MHPIYFKLGFDFFPVFSLPGREIRDGAEHLAHGRPALELARKADAGVGRARRRQRQVGEAGAPCEVAVVEEDMMSEGLMVLCSEARGKKAA